MGSSDSFAQALEGLNPVFRTYRDSILLIHAGQKEVSSSLGHKLMNNSPFANTRYKSAEDRVGRLADILKSGDLEAFMELTEKEALALHGLMMLSDPPFVLMQANTIKAIQLLKEFRKETKIPVCFTLDAGPNLHILYPEEYYTPMKSFIESALVPLCQDGKWLDDYVGRGPINMLKFD